MPVSKVPDALRDLWSQTEHGDPSGSGIVHNYRAVQSNLILHFGLRTQRDEARNILDHALEFAGRYPCRIICLCPSERAGEHLLRGKLFSQCLLSGGGGHPVCSEALMLGYSLEDSRFLEHQVSIWLESDLPTYHWFHKVPAERIRDCYMPFLKMVTRATYDSSLEGGEGLSGLDWPCPRGARDLAEARMLHVRQGLGQILSGFGIGELLGGLVSVRTSHGPGKSGEAKALDQWMGDCIDTASIDHEVLRSVDGMPGLEGIRCVWKYVGDPTKELDLELLPDLSRGNLAIDVGKGRKTFPLQMKAPSPALALSEALYF
jgi:hypothetical protein